MNKCKSPKQKFKFFYFLIFTICTVGTVVELKNIMARITGSSLDDFFILQE